jgi:hypothetical protein
MSVVFDCQLLVSVRVKTQWDESYLIKISVCLTPCVTIAGSGLCVLGAVHL